MCPARRVPSFQGYRSWSKREARGRSKRGSFAMDGKSSAHGRVYSALAKTCRWTNPIIKLSEVICDCPGPTLLAFPLTSASGGFGPMSLPTAR